MENREQVYDELISPLMTQIIAICKEHQLPMFAEFQYSDTDFCKTAIILPGGHPVLQHYNALSQCKAGDEGINVDKYLIWLMRGAKERGHCSIYLHMLGVPETPEDLPEP